MPRLGHACCYWPSDLPVWWDQKKELSKKKKKGTIERFKKDAGERDKGSF